MKNTKLRFYRFITLNYRWNTIELGLYAYDRKEATKKAKKYVAKSLSVPALGSIIKAKNVKIKLMNVLHNTRDFKYEV